MIAIFKREFKAYFNTPLGYIILAAFYFFSGLYFYDYFSYGVPNVEYIISDMLSVVIFVMPILTMRLMSDDKRQKVDQVLFTAPIRLTSIVLGKFLAALAVFALGFLPTIAFEMIVTSYVDVNIFNYVYALVGVVLLGSALIAMGMFISALTESAVLAAILTLFVNIFLVYLPSFATMVKSEWIAKVLEKMAFITKYTSFIENTLSIPDIIYFLSITVAFVFLSVRVLERRRWA